MTIVAALLVPGSPLPQVARDNPPWGALADALEAAGAALAKAAPDTLVIYSTQWLAVLDELWLTRARMQGEHVDDNWHEYGALPYDIRIDTQLTQAIVAATPAVGVRSKGVDYDGFPLDTGTIVASNFLNPDGRAALAVAANNLYHDWQTTEQLGRVAAQQAQALGRRIAVVGVGADAHAQAALLPYCQDGAHGSVFDGAEDRLDFSDVLTFEMEEIMGRPKAAAPASPVCASRS